MPKMRKKTILFGIMIIGITHMFIFGVFPNKSNASKALFENRCSQCHGLNQADQVDSYLPSNVQQMVMRMQHKPQSGISSEEAEEIYEYLVYQFSKTHKAEIDKELSALPEDKRKEEQAKIDQIAAKF